MCWLEGEEQEQQQKKQRKENKNVFSSRSRSNVVKQARHTHTRIHALQPKQNSLIFLKGFPLWKAFFSFGEL